MTSIGGLKTFTYATYRDGTEKVSSDHIKNKSTVDGNTVSDALDYLLDNAGGGIGDAYLPVGAGSDGQHLRTNGATASWSNNINLAPGSLASPGLVISNDLDTGIFAPSANTLAFVCGGTTEASISSTGIISTNYLVAPKLKINNGIALGNTLISDATGEFFSTNVQTALQSANSFGVNTFIGQSAGTNGSGFNYVVGIGYQSFGGFAGLPTSATSGSLAVGQGTLYSITSGARNSALGFQSQSSIDTGSDNTTLGYQSMQAGNGAVSNCTAFGSQTLVGALTTGANGATAIGFKALNTLTSGANNTAVGYNNQLTITTGNNNTTVGYGVMDASALGCANNTAIGSNALGGALTTGADGSTAVGSTALTALTSGVGNTAVGFANQLLITTGNNNTSVGYRVMDASALGCANNVGIGSNALGGAMTTGADGSTAVGSSALTALTSGVGNTAVGYQNQLLITTGANNTSVGYRVMDASALGCANNVGIGSNALGGAMTTGADGSTAIGSSALTALTSGAQNTGVGYQNQKVITTGANNTTVGYNVMSHASVAVASSYNVGIGASTLAGALTVGANGSVAVGSNALQFLTSGAQNTAVGYLGQNVITTGASNTTLGYNVMGNASTAVATSNCVGVGALALSGVLTAGANGAVAIGNTALTALTSGAQNTAVGYASGASLTTGGNNTSVGFRSLDQSAVDVNYCTAIGSEALGGALTNTANGSTAIGASALLVLTSGSNNTGVGYNAGSTLTTGSNNTLLGYNTSVNAVGRAGTIVLGKDAVGSVDNGLFVPTTLASMTTATSPLCFDSATGQIGTAPIAYTDVITSDEVIAVNNTVVDSSLSVSVPAGTYKFNYMGCLINSTATGGSITVRCSTASTITYTGMSQINGSSGVPIDYNSQAVLAGNTGGIIADAGSTSTQVCQAQGTLTCASACVFTVAVYSSANQTKTLTKGTTFSLTRTS